MIDPVALARTAGWLAASERVLIGAGAGLSVAAGIDYGDPVSFARLFPAMVKRGFRARYQLIGYPHLSATVYWGYWARHVHDVRFTDRQAPVYAQLRELADGKDMFVLTSNVDAMFPRHGFDPSRLFTPQGDYAAMQCMTHDSAACRDRVWPSRPIVERLLAARDPESEEVTDRSALPACPDCGGEVFLNVRLNGAFVEAPYVEQAERFGAWLRAGGDAPLLIIEIGAGFNTPSVVRWPLENIVSRNPHARFVRINLAHVDVPDQIAARSTSLQGDAAAILDAIRRNRLSFPDV